MTTAVFNTIVRRLNVARISDLKNIYENVILLDESCIYFDLLNLNRQS